MATNKLMEAAAEILSSSKKSAPAMPPEKLAGEVHDAGGPTPQNYKNDDDSAKITPSSKSATAPTTKPSAASPDKQEMLGGGKKEMKEEQEQIDELKKSTLGSYVKKAAKDQAGDAFEHGEDEHRQYGEPGEDPDRDKDIADRERRMANREKGIGSAVKRLAKEDIDALFADDSTISEEFKTKAATIFEARVFDRVNQIEEEIEAKYADMLSEAVDQIKSDLTTKVDDYLNYVVEQWLADNEIAIESGLRAELTEEFIAGLRNLFAEHYIDVPAEKVDLVDELAGKVEELESKLNEEIERGISYAKALVESRKSEITREVTEGLTTTQAEKVKTLAESVEFSTEEEYKEKLETIRENYFPSGVKKANETQLHETVEETEEQKVIADPFVAAVSKAISKTKI
jgi:hypothetical protein